MKRLLVTSMMVMLVQMALAAYTRLNLSEAIKNKVVKMDAVNTEGAYQGKTTTITLTNTGKSALQIKIDIGTILAPDNKRYQPLILAGEELLVLAPMGTGNVAVQTFCGHSHKSCPASNHHYSYSHLAGDTLVTVLKFIKANSIFDWLGQDAVWAVTNNQSLSDIYDNTRIALSGQLMEVVRKATGRPKPDYFTVSAPSPQVPDSPAYVPKPLKIIATFTILLQAAKVMTLGVYNDKGEMIQKVFEDQEFAKSGHEFGVEFEAADVPPGYYFIRLMEGATVLQEKKVKVE